MILNQRQHTPVSSKCTPRSDRKHNSQSRYEAVLIIKSPFRHQNRTPIAPLSLRFPFSSYQDLLWTGKISSRNVGLLLTGPEDRGIGSKDKSNNKDKRQRQRQRQKQRRPRTKTEGETEAKITKAKTQTV